MFFAGGIEDDTAKDMRTMGASEAEIAAWAAERDGGNGSGDTDGNTLNVWPENWPAVQLFARVITQWHSGPIGLPTGLDYSAVEATMRMTGVKKSERATMLEDLRVMEAAALREVQTHGR